MERGVPIREFQTPSYGEWVKESQALPWAEDTQPSHQSDFETLSTYLHSGGMIAASLSISDRFDYYEPTRAASILSDMIILPSLRQGILAYAAWMVQQDSIPITQLMGAEIARGVLKLKEKLGIPEQTAKYIESLLQEKGQAEFESHSALIVQEWLNAEKQESFAVFLRIRSRDPESVQDETSS